MQRTVADHRAPAVVEVEHRSEAEIHTVRGELGADDVGDRARRLARRRRVAVPQPPERAHRRNGGEALTKALHPAALVVSAEEQLGLAQSRYLCCETGQLFRVLVITGEENDPAGGRMAQAVPILIVERGADHVDHRRPERQPQPAHSRITVAIATPRSSVRETCE